MEQVQPLKSADPGWGPADQSLLPGPMGGLASSGMFLAEGLLLGDLLSPS